jgi:hypothetical protein
MGCYIQCQLIPRVALLSKYSIAIGWGNWRLAPTTILPVIGLGKRQCCFVKSLNLHGRISDLLIELAI